MLDRRWSMVILMSCYFIFEPWCEKYTDKTGQSRDLFDQFSLCMENA